MIHRAARALPLLVLPGLLLLVGAAGQAQEGEPAPFEIRLPPEIRSEQVQIHYYLTGRFGGHGDFLKSEPERNSYLIDTSVNHQAAESLKVILYAPGCQIVTLTVPSLSESDKGADVTCEDLPFMTLNGRVELPEALRGRPYEVDITYMAYWAHSFFHIADGPVTTFLLTRASPDESGAFQVQLPNFAKDAVTQAFRREAGLRFVARDRDTGNTVSLLAPANLQGKDPYELSIRAKYRSEVVFKTVPESTPNRTAGSTRNGAR